MLPGYELKPLSVHLRTDRSWLGTGCQPTSEHRSLSLRFVPLLRNGSLRARTVTEVLMLAVVIVIGFES